MIILPRREGSCQVPNKCRNCGAEDFTPKYINYGFCDSQMGVPVCPSCGSSEIDIGISCPLCGRFTTDAYCGDCENNLRERFHELLISNFSAEEIKALNEIYDGKDIE